MGAGQEALRTFSRRLVEVQEAERRQIARELHDEVGQILIGLTLILSLEAEPGRGTRLIAELPIVRPG